MVGPVVPECPAQMYGTTVEISIRSLGSLQVYVHVAMCIRMSGEWLGNPSMFPSHPMIQIDVDAYPMVGALNMCYRSRSLNENSENKVPSLHTKPREDVYN